MDDIECRYAEAVTNSAGITPERLPDGRYRYELAEQSSHYLTIRDTATITVEIGDSPAIELLRASVGAPVDAEWFAAQSAVAARDWRRGWVPIGGTWETELNLATEQNLEHVGVPPGTTLLVWHSVDAFSFDWLAPQSVRMAVTVGVDLSEVQRSPRPRE